MSGMKRPRGLSPPKPTNGSTPAKKRCITDFFSPKPKLDSASPRVAPMGFISSNHYVMPNSPPDVASIPPEKLISTPRPSVNKENTSFMSRLESPRATGNIDHSKTPSTSRTPSKHSNDKSMMNKGHTNGQSCSLATPDEQHLHLSYKFLYPPHRRDIDKRPPDHPDYDKNTLYVPESFLNSQTPALRQWWLIKQRHMDAILFFKMGKFYELFNEDAVIGVNNLDISYMKGDETKPAHAGFPEVSYEKYSKKLIEKGFKVIRIEQTETPAMMEERCQLTGLRGKFDKVVRREVCRVTTKGTQMLGVMESDFHSASDQFLLAVRQSDEQLINYDRRNSKVFGVCFVDVTIGKIYIGQFTDDTNYSKINILLSHYKPTEVIFERGNLDREVNQALMRTGALLTSLRPINEFWPIKKALSYIKTHNIFENGDMQFQWPTVLAGLFEGDSSENILSLEPRQEFTQALESFGAIVYYLQSQLIADQVLRCSSFELYVTPIELAKSSPSKFSGFQAPPLILDHIALRNLEVFENSQGGSESTLFESINHCKTHFGQRLLRNWLCSPLCNINQINNRLDAVQALISNENASLMNEIAHVLSQTPDLERFLSKVKSQCFKSESDTRAIMFDGDHHSKAKISSFLNLLDNFRRLRKFIISVEKGAKKCDSAVLRRLLSFTNDGGLFPDYEASLEYFNSSFNHEMAKKTGKIIPEPGVHTDYDRCKASIEEINNDLNDYLEEQKEILKCKSIEYFGTAKNRFQIQVPEAYCKRVPSDYRIETTRKGFKRYYTPKIDKLFQKLTVSEEQMKKTLEGIMSEIFAQFASKMKLWSSAIECIAILDVLQSIASFVRSLMARNIDVCRPQFTESKNPFIKYTEGRHPGLVNANPDFIANDLLLDERLILLTGANMGGKSTLMRQTSLMVILAQIGSFVPASSFKLTPVDRIFSRLGASDRLLEGESTFYTELVETSAMLRYATRDSLLLLDELGRGTSTYDGTAIAYSVIQEISNNIKCRCLFSTHYHSLVRDFTNISNVRLAHMGCKIEKESNDDIDCDPIKENITFLYKVTEGPVARSYGFNVAKLAGIDNFVIREAYQKSRELELASKVIEKMQTLCRGDRSLNDEELKRKVSLSLA